MSTSCYEGSKLGDPLLFFSSLFLSFLFLFSVSFHHWPFFDLSPRYILERKEERYIYIYGGKRIFRRLFKEPFRVYLPRKSTVEIGVAAGVSLVSTPSSALLCTYGRTYYLSSHRGKHSLTARSDPYQLFDFGFRSRVDLSGFAHRRVYK